MAKRTRKLEETFYSFKREAEDTLRDKEKMKKLVDAVKDKLGDVKELSGKLLIFKTKVKTLVRMVRATIRKEYTALSTKSILMMLMGLLYFLSPIDLIPDFITGIGLIDDMTIIFWIYNNLKDEIAQFESWESSQAISIDPD